MQIFTFSESSKKTTFFCRFNSFSIISNLFSSFLRRWKSSALVFEIPVLAERRRQNVEKYVCKVYCIITHEI